jgi:hypothetical protein
MPVWTLDRGSTPEKISKMAVETKWEESASSSSRRGYGQIEKAPDVDAHEVVDDFWLRGPDLNQRPLGYEGKTLRHPIQT